MGLIFKGSTLIPLQLTMYPSTFPHVTPNEHFLQVQQQIIVSKSGEELSICTPLPLYALSYVTE